VKHCLSRRGCSLPRSALPNRARLAANSRYRSSVIKRRPAAKRAARSWGHYVI
jgi:hypothetical protein